MEVVFIVFVILLLSILFLGVCFGLFVIALEVMNAINEEWENINGNK